MSNVMLDVTAEDFQAATEKALRPLVHILERHLVWQDWRTSWLMWPRYRRAWTIDLPRLRARMFGLRTAGELKSHPWRNNAPTMKRILAGKLPSNCTSRARSSLNPIAVSRLMTDATHMSGSCRWLRVAVGVSRLGARAQSHCADRAGVIGLLSAQTLADVLKRLRRIAQSH
jgi:hypothetical protein